MTFGRGYERRGGRRFDDRCGSLVAPENVALEVITASADRGGSLVEREGETRDRALCQDDVHAIGSAIAVDACDVRRSPRPGVCAAALRVHSVDRCVATRLLAGVRRFSESDDTRRAMQTPYRRQFVRRAWGRALPS